MTSRPTRHRVLERRRTFDAKIPRTLTIFTSFTLGDGEGVLASVQVPYETRWFESQIQAHVVGVVDSSIDGDRT